MDLLKAYGSDDEAQKERQHAPLAMPTSSPELELPTDISTMFADSDYDLEVERRRVKEKRGNSRWKRSFPHERGNWPTYVYIAGDSQDHARLDAMPNTREFVRMAKASVEHLRRRLLRAVEGGDHRAFKKKRVEGMRGGSLLNDVHNWQGKRTDRHLLGGGPVEVVVNDFESEGVQHLSLSKTFVLRAHQIQSFNKALAESVKSTRRFTIVVTGDYDVLVNEDRTRSFLCLRTAGGSRQVQGLVDKVDQLLKRYNKPTYYEDPILHVSVASMPGDVASLLQESEGNEGPGTFDTLHEEDGPGGQEEGEEEEGDCPTEVCVDASCVTCKASNVLFQAPLLGGEGR